MEPRWRPVASTDLDAIAYEPVKKRFWIRFRSGAIYEYHDVPPVVYDELMAAPSKDGYFSEYIRPEYRYTRIRGAVEAVPAAAR